MSADVTLKNGVAYTENLVVEAPGLKGEVKGWINFTTQHCDLKVKLTLFGELAGLARLIPVAGEPTARAGADLSSIYVRVSGHWDSLKYSVYNPLDPSMPAPPE